MIPIHALWRYLKPFVNMVRRENLHRVIIVLLLILVLGSFAFSWFEENLGYADSLWWTVVTMTTVGYGDISPVSTGGRIVGATVMLLGIGLLGVFTATVAGVFIEHKIKEDKGMKPVNVKNHFVICGWNFRGADIIAELRADPKSAKSPILIMADILEKPIEGDNLYFLRGEVDPDTMEKGNMGEALSAIILSDDSLDAYARDAKTILTTLAIKSLYPKVYTCVELMQSKNIDHCNRVNADEVIVVGELSTNLLVQAALDHGITHLITELVSTRYGSDLYKVRVPESMIGRTFYDIMCELKQTKNVLCLGVENHSGRGLVANPESDYTFEEGDHLVIIASERPELT